jgi:hypothetical protein
MNNKELYCFGCDIYATVLNEKASIRSRGFFGGAWRRPHDSPIVPIIILLHGKERKPFMEFYV